MYKKGVLLTQKEDQGFTILVSEDTKNEESVKGTVVHVYPEIHPVMEVGTYLETWVLSNLEPIEPQEIFIGIDIDEELDWDSNPLVETNDGDILRVFWNDEEYIKGVLIQTKDNNNIGDIAKYLKDQSIVEVDLVEPKEEISYMEKLYQDSLPKAPQEGKDNLEDLIKQYKPMSKVLKSEEDHNNILNIISNINNINKSEKVEDNIKDNIKDLIKSIYHNPNFKG